MCVTVCLHDSNVQVITADNDGASEDRCPMVVSGRKRCRSTRPSIRPAGQPQERVSGVCSRSTTTDGHEAQSFEENEEYPPMPDQL